MVFVIWLVCLFMFVVLLVGCWPLFAVYFGFWFALIWCKFVCDCYLLVGLVSCLLGCVGLFIVVAVVM